MNEEQPPEPFTTVELKTQRLPFSTPEDLINWIKREREFWKWAESSSQPVRTLFATSQTHWQSLERQLTAYIKNPNTGTLTQIEKYAKALASGLPFSSHDRRAQFAATLHEDDPSEAANVLQQFARTLSPNSKNMVAAVRATLFELGIDQRAADAGGRALNAVRQDWSSFIQEAKTLSKELVARATQFDADSNNLLEQKTSSFDSSIEEFSTKSTEQLTAGKTELDNIRDTYDERLAVQSSVDYWTKRAESHHEEKDRARNFFASYLALLILAIVISATLIARSITPAQAVEFANSPLVGSYWPVTVLVGLSLLFIWPLRIAARLYLSNVHLGIAAEERVTMINTFLALLRSDKALEPEDRKLILDSLFRHLATGIVKDDGAPTNAVIEAISKMVSK